MVLVFIFISFIIIARFYDKIKVILQIKKARVLWTTRLAKTMNLDEPQLKIQHPYRVARKISTKSRSKTK